jgi:paraquat-inducible protein B
MRSRRTQQVRIGAFVVGGIAILVASILWIGTGRVFRSTHKFVSYFEGSVNGLRAGAPVKYKGVELGNVTRIRIPFWLAETDPPIAVFFSLDGDKLESMEDGQGPNEETLRAAIEQGLRAQLETDSFVTGILHVSLSIEPESKARLHDPISGVLEIPTIPTTQQEIGAQVRALADIEALFASLQRALDGVTELTTAPEVRGVVTSLDRTLVDFDAAIRELTPLAAELRALVERAGGVGSDLQAGIASSREALASVDQLARELSATLPPLAASLQRTSERLQTTLDATSVLLDPRAPLVVELRDGLAELTDTARSARSLFELLERDPAALLRGRGTKDEGTR